jgi:hypothetical protein
MWKKYVRESVGKENDMWGLGAACMWPLFLCPVSPVEISLK